MSNGRAITFSASAAALVFLITLPVAALVPPMLFLSLFASRRFGVSGLAEWLFELGSDDASTLRLVIVIAYAVFCIGFAIWSSVRSFFSFYTLVSPVKPRSESD